MMTKKAFQTDGFGAGCFGVTLVGFIGVVTGLMYLTHFI